MTTQAVQPRWWQNLKQVLTGTGDPSDREDFIRRVIINETNAYTLPRTTRKIRVARGGAWVSYRREDLVVQTGQTLRVLPDPDGVVVTAIGHVPVELEIYR